MQRYFSAVEAEGGVPMWAVPGLEADDMVASVVASLTVSKHRGTACLTLIANVMTPRAPPAVNLETKNSRTLWAGIHYAGPPSLLRLPVAPVTSFVF